MLPPHVREGIDLTTEQEEHIEELEKLNDVDRRNGDRKGPKK